MYKVSLHNKSAKYYQSLDDKTAKRVNKAIDSISNNPYEGQHITKLKGKLEGKYRYAVGDLRVVYSIKENDKTVIIEAIGHRGSIYK